MDAPILVSACLLGCGCTYTGGDERRRGLLDALQATRRPVVPVCPEVAGGLPVPRPRCEVERGDGEAVVDGRGRVLDAYGRDHTSAYLAGAQVALEAARRHGAALAVLKDRSPSCGSRGVYDGTHARVLRSDGLGVTAALLKRSGVEVVTEDTAAEALRH